MFDLLAISIVSLYVFSAWALIPSGAKSRSLIYWVAAEFYMLCGVIIVTNLYESITLIDQLFIAATLEALFAVAFLSIGACAQVTLSLIAVAIYSGTMVAEVFGINTDFMRNPSLVFLQILQLLVAYYVFPPYIRVVFARHRHGFKH